MKTFLIDQGADTSLVNSGNINNVIMSDLSWFEFQFQNYLEDLQHMHLVDVLFVLFLQMVKYQLFSQ